MRYHILLFTLLVSLLTTATANTLTYPRTDQTTTYLPIIIDNVTHINSMRNGSFENGWINMPPVESLINQEPTDWTIEFTPLGHQLFNLDETASLIPEAVHKHASQLPPDEQLGEPNALILDREYVYKIFGYHGSFGAELAQTVPTELDTTYNLIIPIRIHANTKMQRYDFGVRIFINDYDATEWLWIGNMNGISPAYPDITDRIWIPLLIPFEGTGSDRIRIQIANRFPKSYDFFIDDVQLNAYH